MYGATSLASHFPRSQTPSVTAGLKCPPEIYPPAKIITMSAEPIASGASGPAPLPMTEHPMVRTRKKVPMNSAIYFFMTYSFDSRLKRLPLAAMCGFGSPHGHPRRPPKELVSVPERSGILHVHEKRLRREGRQARK